MGSRGRYSAGSYPAIDGAPPPGLAIVLTIIVLALLAGCIGLIVGLIAGPIVEFRSA